MADSKIYVARFILVEIKADIDMGKIAGSRDIGKITKDETVLFAEIEMADQVSRGFAEMLLENLRNRKDGWEYRIEPSSFELNGGGYTVIQIRNIDGIERSVEAANFSFHEAALEPELLVNRHLVERVENAIWNDDLAALKKLLKKGLSVNSKLYGVTPLICEAVELERVAIAKYLLKNGADPKKLPYCDSPLTAAMYAGNFELFKLLLKYGATIDYRKIDYMELFHSYHCHKNLAFTRFLVENGADVNNRDENGWSALHTAAENGHLELVRFLVEHGADPNAADEYEVKPLNDYVKDKKIRECLAGAGAHVGRPRHLINLARTQGKKSAVKKPRMPKLTKKKIKKLRDDIAESEKEWVREEM